MTNQDRYNLTSQQYFFWILFVGSIAVITSAAWSNPLPMPDWPQMDKEKVLSKPQKNLNASSELDTEQKVQQEKANDSDSLITMRVNQDVEEVNLNPNEDLSESLISPDPITAEKVEILRATGLIARQSAIAESIIIMERQLRQAELIQQLMKIYGPQTPIEIAPGEYKSFETTPAGRQITFEIEEAESLARIRLLELKQSEMALINPTDSIANQPLSFEIPPPDLPIVEHEVIWPQLVEILGTNGKLQAGIVVDGKTVVVSVGDKLPDGTEILSISDQSVRLKMGLHERELRLGW